jgi:hypothetical protein
MKYLAYQSFLVTLLLLVASTSAYAQGYPPNYQFSPYARPNYVGTPRPQLSPYLNLLRGGNPAANYFLGVLPEFERRANTYQFGNAISDLEQRDSMINASGDPLELTSGTGHPTAFANTGSYFGNGASQRFQPSAASPQQGGRRTR